MSKNGTHFWCMSCLCDICINAKDCKERPCGKCDHGTHEIEDCKKFISE